MCCSHCSSSACPSASSDVVPPVARSESTASNRSPDMPVPAIKRCDDANMPPTKMPVPATAMRYAWAPVATPTARAANAKIRSRGFLSVLRKRMTVRAPTSPMPLAMLSPIDTTIRADTTPATASVWTKNLSGGGDCWIRRYASATVSDSRKATTMGYTGVRVWRIDAVALITNTPTMTSASSRARTWSTSGARAAAAP